MLALQNTSYAVSGIRKPHPGTYFGLNYVMKTVGGLPLRHMAVVQDLKGAVALALEYSQESVPHCSHSKR